MRTRHLRKPLAVVGALWLTSRFLDDQRASPVRNEGYTPHHDARSRVVDVDGPVHYVEFDGPAGAPTAVLVHGIGGSHVTWLPLAARLAPHHRVLVIDLPGHGLTPLGTRQASLRAQHRLLRRFLDELIDDEVLLIGHSMGALLCLRQAAHHPERTRAVVLVDPAIRTPGAPAVPEWVGSEPFRRYAASVATQRMLTRRRGLAAHATVLDAQLAMSCADPSTVSSETRALYLDVATRRDGQAGTHRAFIQSTASLARFSRDGRRPHRLADRIRGPVLVVHGANDLLVDVDTVRSFTARHDGWRLQVATNAGHVPMLEQPDWTFEQVLQAFGSNVGPA